MRLIRLLTNWFFILSAPLWAALLVWWYFAEGIYFRYQKILDTLTGKIWFSKGLEDVIEYAEATETARP